MDDAAASEVWDYVVVGSGAGGGTVAARLAERGHSVLVLEAGGDPGGGDPRLPDDYDVPAFHPFATENPALAWNFWVEHYADPAKQAADPKRREEGVLYPRASTVGGCTAHNAMIFIRPDDADWKAIEALTGDPSWSPRSMHGYFRRLEACHHRPWPRFLARLGLDYSGHGWTGWLSAERALPAKAAFDRDLVDLLAGSAQAALLRVPRVLGFLAHYLVGRSDPNARLQAGGRKLRLWYTPLTTSGHRRRGTRERLAWAKDKAAGRLEVRQYALATEVLFDGDRAVGVAYRHGRDLYRASPRCQGAAGTPLSVLARREVILAGGAFNTPQLLMLSGIGPAAALAEKGVASRVDLPGVGQNLQDRYEVGVVHRLSRSWRVMAGAKFDRTDKLWAEWREGCGMYISNGAAVAVAKRSPGRRDGLRDLFFMALLAPFRGYFPGYSDEIRRRQDCLTWTILKARTENRGEVALASDDPLEPPKVNFRYFEEGGGDAGADMAAVVHAVEFARKLAKPLKADGLIAEEEEPGPAVRTREEIARYVHDRAWGHHASCTCAIGPREAGGVVDSDFRVHGARGLRVVDASVFPRIPGFFIACAVYMIGEKAADVIHAAALASDREASRAPAAAA